MLGLPIPEFVIFVSVVLIYLAAAIIDTFQLLSGGDKRSHLLRPLVGLAIVLEAVILVLRGISINAFPLTGLFESMVLLTIIFGLAYLFLSLSIKQIWFGSVMVWVVLLVFLLAISVAAPASKPYIIAATPWAMAHAISMILFGSSMTFGAVAAFLYLLNRSELKQKRAAKVLGKIPNMEKLERMNLFALELCFILITFGIVSGVGMLVINRATLGIEISSWLTDPKFILIAIIWLLLGMIVVLRRMLVLKSRTAAYLTILTFILVLFTLVGTTVFCGTSHNFIKSETMVHERE
jgi:ABC-type transport system involved in cytochrome c biogenesis permease subunit